MQNEFYSVEYDYGYGDPHYFKNKDHAFAFLWQKFLICCDNASDEYIKEAFEKMNETYAIEDFGWVQVCGFED